MFCLPKTAWPPTCFPETGSRNTSVIHWDMICDMRTDSEIGVDGDVIYRNGKFI